MNLVRLFRLPLIFGLALLSFSCSQSPKKEKPKALSTEDITSTLDNKEVKKVAPHPGQAVYNQYCLACHQTDGSGVPGMHPPLWDENWLKDNDKLIRIILKGMSGKVEVDGEIYNNLMPSHAHLTDQEIANVLSYIRKNFGNNLGGITADEVKAQRN